MRYTPGWALVVLLLPNVYAHPKLGIRDTYTPSPPYTLTTPDPHATSTTSCYTVPMGPAVCSTSYEGQSKYCADFGQLAGTTCWTYYMALQFTTTSTSTSTAFVASTSDTPASSPTLFSTPSPSPSVSLSSPTTTTGGDGTPTSSTSSYGLVGQGYDLTTSVASPSPSSNSDISPSTTLGTASATTSSSPSMPSSRTTWSSNTSKTSLTSLGATNSSHSVFTAPASGSSDVFGSGPTLGPLCASFILVNGSYGVYCNITESEPSITSVFSVSTSTPDFTPTLPSTTTGFVCGEGLDKRMTCQLPTSSSTVCTDTTTNVGMG